MLKLIILSLLTTISLNAENIAFKINTGRTADNVDSINIYSFIQEGVTLKDADFSMYLGLGGKKHVIDRAVYVVGQEFTLTHNKKREKGYDNSSVLRGAHLLFTETFDYPSKETSDGKRRFVTYKGSLDYDTFSELLSTNGSSLEAINFVFSMVKNGVDFYKADFPLNCNIVDELIDGKAKRIKMTLISEIINALKKK